MKGDSIPEILKWYSQRVCRNESAEHTIKVTHKHPFTALKIHVSKRTRDLLERCATNKYQLSCRGLTEIKVSLIFHESVLHSYIIQVVVIQIGFNIWTKLYDAVHYTRQRMSS